jgi:hypothetical protein
LNATWATVIVSISALILLSVIVFMVASAFRQSLQSLSRMSERRDDRHQRHLDTVLDRLMAIKWEDYAAIRATDEDIDGGFYPPMRDDSEDTAVMHIKEPKWGHLGTLSERARLNEEEAIIIEEDFDEEGSPRRAGE